MADADPIHRRLHPETLRQAAYPDWTADPAIPALFAILRDLSALGARLEALNHDRPDLAAGGVRGELGEVASIHERCPGRFFGYGYRTRANGGACAGLWELLAGRRDAWIDARLEVEGFAPLVWSEAKDTRTTELAGEATPVEVAWNAFSAGAGSEA